MKSKQKGVHYVNNKEFYAAMCDYIEKCNDAKSKGLEQPIITNYIATCIINIANKLSNRPNFINYTYKDEMIEDAIEVCLAKVTKFDPTKYDNPFSYFTMIAWNQFLHRIEKEKKEQYIKAKLLENAMITNDQFSFQDSDDKPVRGISNYNEATIHIIRTYEEKLLAKKNANKKKNLDNFIEDDNV